MRLTHALVSVAQALADQPHQRHWGYDLSRQIGVRSGVLYPILGRMLDQDWLCDGWEDRQPAGRPPRRYYEVTEVGHVELKVLLERARGDPRFVDKREVRA